MTLYYAEGLDARLIEERISVTGEPHRISLDSETHIFHFGSNRYDWDDPDPGVIFVNRNGNFFRLLQDGETLLWRYADTWSRIDGAEHYQLSPVMDDVSPMNVIAKSTIGDKRTGRHSMTYLPKECFGPGVRRSVVWRNLHLRVKYPNNDDFNSFYLIAPDGKRSPTFLGKIWDSVPALDWCDANLASHPIEFVANSNVAINRTKDLAAALSDNPLFGSF